MQKFYGTIGGDNLKHGRRLTRKEKIMLEKYNLDSKNYLRVKQDAETITFIRRGTDRTLKLMKVW